MLSFVGGGEVCVLFLSLSEANMPNLSLLKCIERFKKFLVVGCGGVVGCGVVVEAHFSVQLKPKPN